MVIAIAVFRRNWHDIVSASADRQIIVTHIYMIDGECPFNSNANRPDYDTVNRTVFENYQTTDYKAIGYNC